MLAKQVSATFLSISTRPKDICDLIHACGGEAMMKSHMTRERSKAKDEAFSHEVDLSKSLYSKWWILSSPSTHM